MRVGESVADVQEAAEVTAFPAQAHNFPAESTALASLATDFPETANFPFDHVEPTPVDIEIESDAITEPLRLTDDPDHPELKDGFRYIRPGKPMKFELIFTKRVVEEKDDEVDDKVEDEEKEDANPNENADKPLPEEFKEVAVVFNSGKALLDIDNDKTMGPMQRGGPSQVPEFDLFAGWGAPDDGGRDAISPGR